MEIEDQKYDALLAFMETGASGDLPQEMVEYLGVLELIRGLHMRFSSRDSIVNLLQQPPYLLSRHLSLKYYSDAINFFYLDNQIKKQAWRNVYAEQLDRAAELILKTAKTSKDLDIFKNIKLAAATMRQLDTPEQDDIPEDFFKKPIKLYVLDPELVGRKRPNRNLLAKHIDSLDIPETDKERLKGDAMITDVEFILDEDEGDQ